MAKKTQQAKPHKYNRENKRYHEYHCAENGTAHRDTKQRHYNTQDNEQDSHRERQIGGGLTHDNRECPPETIRIRIYFAQLVTLAHRSAQNTHSGKDCRLEYNDQDHRNEESSIPRRRVV